MHVVAVAETVVPGAGALGDARSPYHLAVRTLPPGHFTVHSFRGREGLSKLYAFDVDVTCAAADEAIERLSLGQPAVLTSRVGMAPRAIHGIVARIDALGACEARDAHQYRIRLVPRMWLLRRRKGSRIFQRMRIDEVVNAVCAQAGVATRWWLRRSHPAREYCTQYEETDFEFITRILAEEGVFFTFAQESAPIDLLANIAGAAAGTGAAATIASAVAGAALDALFGGETAVFADDALWYPPICDGSVISEVANVVGAVGAGVLIDVGSVSAAAAVAPKLFYLASAGTTTAKHDKVTKFVAGAEVRSNSAEFSVFDPARPQAPLVSRDATTDLLSDAFSALTGAASAAVAGTVASATSAIPGAASVAAAAATAADALLGGLLGTADLEVYEHHANYHFPEWDWLKEEPGLILRQKRRRARGGAGESGCPTLTPGHTFALDDHPLAHFNRSWVVASVRHEGHATAPEHATEWQVYRNYFECVPSEVTFCPPRPKQRTMVAALTATVVGPPGEEIHTDAQGRIKVHFHWDRSGRREDASCWIRTMQSWGGANWGTQFIPRVGMEVVVTFDGGDPDKPIVLGCLYNGTHPTTFPPSSDKTRSGIRTNSSPGGAGFNELSFEDKTGAEQVYLHAQRDLDEVVRRDHTARVGRDDVTEIGRSQRTVVSGDRSDLVRGKCDTHLVGDQATHLEGNRRDVVIGSENRRIRGEHQLHLEAPSRVDAVGAAEHSYAADLTTRIGGNHTLIVGKHDAKRAMTLRVEGAGTISADDGLILEAGRGLTLQCGKTSIRIGADGIELNGSMVRVAGDAGGIEVGKDGLTLKSDGVLAQLGKKLLIKTDKASLAMGDECKIDGQKILLNSPEQATEKPPPQPRPPTEIALVDKDDGPLAGQRFSIELEDGSMRTGVTDKDGKATLDLPTDGKIWFPDLAEIEGAAKSDEALSPWIPHVVQQGEYLTKLAARRGATPKDVWDDPRNASIRALRKTGEILHPGDVVHLPESPQGPAKVRTRTSNRYRARVPVVQVAVAFYGKSGPLANEEYTIHGLSGSGGRAVTGVTDGQGAVKVEIPVHLTGVDVYFPRTNQRYSLAVGHLDPATESSGIRDRLRNLGFYGRHNPAAADAEAALQRAILAFQKANDLEATGVADEATRRALAEKHGA